VIVPLEIWALPVVTRQRRKTFAGLFVASTACSVATFRSANPFSVVARYGKVPGRPGATHGLSGGDNRNRRISTRLLAPPEEEARTLKHNRIGTEHILLGLLRYEGRSYLGFHDRCAGDVRARVPHTRTDVPKSGAPVGLWVNVHRGRSMTMPAQHR
jgi:hypothetical protein